MRKVFLFFWVLILVWAQIDVDQFYADNNPPILTVINKKLSNGSYESKCILTGKRLNESILVDGRDVSPDEFSIKYEPENFIIKNHQLVGLLNEIQLRRVECPTFCLKYNSWVKLNFYSLKSHFVKNNVFCAEIFYKTNNCVLEVGMQGINHILPTNVTSSPYKFVANISSLNGVNFFLRKHSKIGECCIHSMKDCALKELKTFTKITRTNDIVYSLKSDPNIRIPPIFDTNEFTFREWNGCILNISQNKLYLYATKHYNNLLVYYRTRAEGDNTEIYSLKQLSSKNCEGSYLKYKYCLVLGGLKPNTKYEMRVFAYFETLKELSNWTTITTKPIFDVTYQWTNNDLLLMWKPLVDVTSNKFFKIVLRNGNNKYTHEIANDVIDIENNIHSYNIYNLLPNTYYYLSISTNEKCETNVTIQPNIQKNGATEVNLMVIIPSVCTCALVLIGVILGIWCIRRNSSRKNSLEKNPVEGKGIEIPKAENVYDEPTRDSQIYDQVVFRQIPIRERAHHHEKNFRDSDIYDVVQNLEVHRR